MDLERLTVTGYKAHTVGVLVANMQALMQEMREIEGQRRKLDETLTAEIHEESERQGIEMPGDVQFRVQVQGDAVIVDWTGEETEGGEP